MEIVVSGIRPTGHLHLGNYFGAIQNFIRMQYEHRCFFFIADYHSLTTHPTPKELNNNVRQVLIEYLASGINPEVATIYIQSDLPETAELYLLLNMNAYLGELERCISFKEKIKSQPENINAGLFTYPVLMAADVIIHKATKVPVGKDQEQHLEMIRAYASRFNRLYNTDYFPEPQAFNFGNKLIKVPGLDGSGKMGKSEGDKNTINLCDTPDVITQKVMKAVTDSGPTLNNQPKPEPIQNLFTLMNLVSDKEICKEFDELYNNCKIKYGLFKKKLSEDIITFTAQFREKIKKLSANTDYLKKVVETGAEKAKNSGSKTIQEVRQIIGIKKI